MKNKSKERHKKVKEEDKRLSSASDNCEAQKDQTGCDVQ